jgi:hypothetical protein
MLMYARAFPDAPTLLSVPLEQLAVLVLPYMASLPSRNPVANRRCFEHLAKAYPTDCRRPLVARLWAARGLLLGLHFIR